MRVTGSIVVVKIQVAWRTNTLGQNAVTVERTPVKSSFASPRVLTGSILFLLAGLAAMGSLATNVILPVFPSMSASLGVGPRDLGLTLSSFFIAFAVGQLFVGPLADRFGRKPLVVGGLVTFVAGSAMCALSQSLDILIWPCYPGPGCLRRVCSGPGDST